MGPFLGIDPGTAVTGYGVVSRQGGGAVLGGVRCDPDLVVRGIAARIREIFRGSVRSSSGFGPRLWPSRTSSRERTSEALSPWATHGAQSSWRRHCRTFPSPSTPPREIKKAVVGTGERHQRSGGLYGAAPAATPRNPRHRPTPQTASLRLFATALRRGAPDGRPPKAPGGMTSPFPVGHRIFPPKRTQRVGAERATPRLEPHPKNPSFL